MNIYNELMPLFKNITAKNASNALEKGMPYNDIHVAIANILNKYFTEIMGKQTLLATGTVMTAGAAVPFTASCVKPVNYSLNLLPNDIYTAFKTGNLAFPNLFEKIGTLMTVNYSQWTGSPIINGVGTSVFVTTHFYTVGLNLYKKLNLLPLTNSSGNYNEDLTKNIWDTVQEHIELALNMIAPINVILTGMTAGGVFTGVANGKFITA